MPVPTGAGKTTFAEQFLPQGADSTHFLNADLIARELDPDNVDAVSVRAARIMLERMDRLASQGADFVFETTLSGRNYVPRIADWRSSGYVVRLIFIRLGSVDLAIERVRRRVREGGHNIPESAIRRRFLAGEQNLLAFTATGWICGRSTMDRSFPLF